MLTGSMQKCDLAVQTQDVVTAYYLLDTDPLFDNIAPNCIWTASNHATYRGAQAIRETLSQPSGMPRFSMYDAHFEVLDDDSPDVAVVMGAYRLLSDVDYQQIMAAGQHATVVWRLFDEGWKIILLHVSNEWAESNPEELYPFKVGRQTWRYAQAIIERGIGGEPQALMLRGGGVKGEIISLDPEDVLFVRANGKHCVLHTFEGDREVACTLAELEGKLSDQFIRVHRSYIVNRSHMRTFDAEGIELVDGTRIPVPAKRRAQLRRLLVS